MKPTFEETAKASFVMIDSCSNLSERLTALEMEMSRVCKNLRTAQGRNFFINKLSEIEVGVSGGQASLRLSEAAKTAINETCGDDSKPHVFRRINDLLEGCSFGLDKLSCYEERQVAGEVVGQWIKEIGKKINREIARGAELRADFLRDHAGASVG